MTRLLAILGLLLALTGAGCATTQARPFDHDPAAHKEGTAVVLVDLTGIRAASEARPEGIRVRLRRVDTDQDLFAFTEATGPTRIEHLPPGEYEVSFDATDLGVSKTVRRGFALKPGDVRRIVLHDGRREFAKSAGEVAGKIGEGALVVGKAVLVVTVVTGYVALQVLAACCGGC